MASRHALVAGDRRARPYAIGAISSKQLQGSYHHVQASHPACRRRRSALALLSTPRPPRKTEKSVTVGRRADVIHKNIVENAVNSKDHTTLVAAVKAAGLVDTLSGKGPFTVFAPTNAAFAKLPAGTVETLVKPENKAMLTKILTCHVVAANAMSPRDQQDDRRRQAATHPVKTVGGCVLQAKKNGNKITLTDEKGGVATVTIADVQAVERRHPRDRQRPAAGQLTVRNSKRRGASPGVVFSEMPMPDFDPA